LARNNVESPRPRLLYRRQSPAIRRHEWLAGAMLACKPRSTTPQPAATTRRLERIAGPVLQKGHVVVGEEPKTRRASLTFCGSYSSIARCGAPASIHSARMDWCASAFRSHSTHLCCGWPSTNNGRSNSPQPRRSTRWIPAPGSGGNTANLGDPKGCAKALHFSSLMKRLAN